MQLDGAVVRSCLLPLSALAERQVTIIEGLAPSDDLHAVRRAWIEEDVPQCGYCQAGQIMAAVDLLKRIPDPSDRDIAALTNLCRCGTYPRICGAQQRPCAARPDLGTAIETRGGAIAITLRRRATMSPA